MGLPSFADDPDLQGFGEALRAVFLPSFHPEVCVTLRPAEGGVCVQATALQRMLWHEPIWCRLPEITSTPAIVPTVSYASLLVSLSEARRSLEDEKGKRYFVIDGMSAHVCHYLLGRTELFSDRRFRTGETDAFTKLLVETAWAATSDPGIANAVAAVGNYADSKYPLVAPPEEPPIRRLLILGGPEERESYFEQLRTRPTTGMSRQ
jgi:hypothetical protein